MEFQDKAMRPIRLRFRTTFCESPCREAPLVSDRCKVQWIRTINRSSSRHSNLCSLRMQMLVKVTVTAHNLTPTEPMASHSLISTKLKMFISKLITVSLLKVEHNNNKWAYTLEQSHKLHMLFQQVQIMDKCCLTVSCQSPRFKVRIKAEIQVGSSTSSMAWWELGLITL